jgi:hypothetical protein
LRVCSSINRTQSVTASPIAPTYLQQSQSIAGNRVSQHNTHPTNPIALPPLFPHVFCFQFTVSPSRISPTIGICICPPPAPAITRARTLAPVAPFPFPTPHDAQHIFSFYTHPHAVTMLRRNAAILYAGS